MQTDTALMVTKYAAGAGLAAYSVPIIGNATGLLGVKQELLVDPLFWIGLTVLFILYNLSKLHSWWQRKADATRLTADGYTNSAIAVRDDIVKQQQETIRKLEQQLEDSIAASKTQLETRAQELEEACKALQSRLDRISRERDTLFHHATVMNSLLEIHHIPRPKFTSERLRVADEASSITQTLDEASESEDIIEEVSETLL